VAGLVAVVALLRPAALLFRGLIANQTVGPGLSNPIRWQSHHHVVRQSSRNGRRRTRSAYGEK
jgi:ATP-binding cassette subfamily B multidrug efflux pump